MSQKYTFHVAGMHCNACILVIEDEIGSLPDITKAKVSLKNHSLEVVGDFGNKTAEQVASDLTEVVRSKGYVVSVEKQLKEKKWADFKIAIPIALSFILLFLLLQKIGIINLVSVGKVNYGTVFIIGIVASLSTCMAVVGGLLLSMSATFAKEGDKIKPQLMFHLGRIVSFFILGGMIGTIGSAFPLSIKVSFLLSLIIGLVMLILGTNLLDVFHFTKKFTPAMPKFIASRAYAVSKLNHSLTPLLVGVATFFLPCGFTQSMQLYTLTTGSFLKGGLTMLVFALGTFPVLALVSFSSFSIKNSSKSGIFFKSAGLIVIIFALFNLINSLVTIGIISPIFNF